MINIRQVIHDLCVGVENVNTETEKCLESLRVNGIILHKVKDKLKDHKEQVSPPSNSKPHTS